LRIEVPAKRQSNRVRKGISMNFLFLKSMKTLVNMIILGRKNQMRPPSPISSLRISGKYLLRARRNQLISRVR
jgi:hypothetical protein